MVFYAACCSNFVIHCCQYWTASTLKQIHNKYCNKWNPNQCAANKLSVSKSWQWYGSYLMAERSSSLPSLPEYTLTYILFLSPCFLLSVLRSFNPDRHTFKASHKHNFLPVFLPSFLPYQICGLVNTLNLIDSHHLSVYVWLFPSVPVVYLYIKYDVREARISPERSMKR